MKIHFIRSDKKRKKKDSETVLIFVFITSEPFETWVSKSKCHEIILKKAKSGSLVK